MRYADPIINYVARSIIDILSVSPVMAHVMSALLYSLKPAVKFGQPSSSIVYNGKPGAKYTLRLSMSVPHTVTRLTQGEQEFVRRHGSTTVQQLAFATTYPTLNTVFGLGMKLYSYKPVVLDLIEKHVSGQDIQNFIESFTTQDLVYDIVRLLHIADTLENDLQIIQSDIINERIEVDPQLVDYVYRHVLFSTIEKIIRDMYVHIVLSNTQSVKNRGIKDQIIQIDNDQILNLYAVLDTFVNVFVENDVIEGVRSLKVSYLDFAVHVIPKIIDDLVQHMSNSLQNSPSPQQQQSGCAGGTCQTQTGQQQTQRQNQGQTQQHGNTGQNQNQTAPSINNVADLVQYYMQHAPDLLLVQSNGGSDSIDASTVQNIINAVEVIQEYVQEKFRGLGSTEIEHYLGNTKEFKLNWLKKLRSSIVQDILSEKLQRDVTYTKPNKLLMWYTRQTGIMFPSQVDYEREYHFIVTIDESGSMGNEELRYFAYLLEELNKIGTVYVVKHDYKVVFEKEFPKQKGGVRNAITEVSRYRHACGGTSHVEAFAYVEEYLKKKKFPRKNQKVYVIVASDMESDIPEALFEHPMLLDDRINIYFLAEKKSYLEKLMKQLRQTFGALQQNWQFIAVEDHV